MVAGVVEVVIGQAGGRLGGARRYENAAAGGQTPSISACTEYPCMYSVFRMYSSVQRYFYYPVAPVSPRLVGGLRRHRAHLR